MKDYYRTLRINPSSCEEEIKKAFRKRALKIHPDKVPEEKREKATRRFKKLLEAFEVLSNPSTKAEYDKSRRPILKIHSEFFKHERCLAPIKSGRRKGQACGRYGCTITSHREADEFLKFIQRLKQFTV